MNKDISSINDDYKYQKAGWPVERAFWVLVSLVLLYGAFGGFGDSPGFLNEGQVNLKGSVVEYDRFLRTEKGDELNIHVTEQVSNLTVAFNNDYVKKVQITQVIPEPEKVEVKNNQVVYTFNTQGNSAITFFIDPMKFGSQALDLEVNGEKMNVSQYIFF